MAGGWKFVSEDEGSISLHDHWISKVDQAGEDLMLHFSSDGFDVTKDNPLNPTERHRNTGPAAIVLKNWRFLEGAFNRDVEVHYPDGTRHYLPEEPLTREMFLSGAFEVEVLDFSWGRESGVFHLDGDGGVYCEDSDARDGPEGFIVLELYAERLLFCWNDLPQDAWFQDWPKM